jgi:anti-anti-sigma factor
MPLEIRREDRSSSVGPAVVLAVVGELDLASLDQLDSAVDTALAADTAHLVLDLEELTFCDSTGLGLFVRAHKRMKDRGGQLSLAAIQPPVLKVIKLTGLDAALYLYPDVSVAISG